MSGAISTVVLNVYDLVVDDTPLTSLNDKTKVFGFGAFHTGVEVFGQEISFGVLTGPPLSTRPDPETQQ